MGRSIAAGEDRTQPNSLRRRLDDIRPNGLSVRIDPNPVGMRALVRRVMAESGTSQKAFALTAGCTESELSDALNGKENRRFEADWIYRQDALFLQRFLNAMAEERAITQQNTRTVARKRIVELIELLLTEVA